MRIGAGLASAELTLLPRLGTASWAAHGKNLLERLDFPHSGKIMPQNALRNWSILTTSRQVSSARQPSILQRSNLREPRYRPRRSLLLEGTVICHRLRRSGDCSGRMA